MKKLHFAFCLCCAVIAFSSCSNKGSDFNYYYYTPEEYLLLSKTLDLPEIPYDYTQKVPDDGFSKMPGKTISRDMAALGRVLFYDTKLSKDNTISCASCHKQELAFGDDRAVSLGVFDRAGDRNSIALLSVTSFANEYGQDLNGSQGKAFFWDNRAATATEQGEGSMTNPKEMDMKMSEVANIVAATPYYEPLFKKAFGDNQVTSERVLEAIASFVNAMGSANSKFDVAVANTRKKTQSIDVSSFPLEGLTEIENTGKSLFLVNCSSCHGTIGMSPFDFQKRAASSNGLDLNPTDKGVGSITKIGADMGTFKIPSLRNVVKTYPYMHDGRFKTLEEVIDFYSTGIKMHENLGPELRDYTTGVAQPKKFNFTKADKDALIAFFNTLTDTEILKDKRFANPYK